MGISVLMLAFTSLEGAGDLLMALIIVWVLICGLTGVPACVATPIIFLRAYLSRSQKHLVLSVVLAFCTFTQLHVILSHPAANRALLYGPRFLLLPTLLQTLYLPIIGVAHANELGQLALKSRFDALLIAAPAVAFIGLVAAIVWRGTKLRRTLLILLSAWLFVSFIQLLGSLGGPEQKLGVFSATAGGRYLAAGQLAIMLAIVLTATTNWRWLTVIFLVVSLYWAVPWTYATQSGYEHSLPRWSSQADRCVSDPCSLAIWPSGWAVKIRH